MRIFCILLFFTCISIEGFSQEKLNKLSVNPIQLLGIGFANFEYERGFKDGKMGVSFFYGTSHGTREIGGYRIYGSEQNVSIKRYSKNMSTNSVWYGGQLSVATSHIYGSSVNSASVETLGLTGKAGYQLIVKSFYLDFYGGLGYAITNNLFGNAHYSGNIRESRLLMFLGIKTGIAF